MKTVTFGAKPSGAKPSGAKPSGAIALKETAVMGERESPEAADTILRNSYVDDILKSVDNVDAAKKLLNEIEQLLRKGGFFIKHWVISGETFESYIKEPSQTERINIIDSPEEKILGMIWEPKHDLLRFKVNINFRVNKNKDTSDLQQNDKHTGNHIPSVLTRRMVLSQISTVYDRLGLLSPVILKSKIMMRSLCDHENGNTYNTDRKVESMWDESMPEVNRLE